MCIDETAAEAHGELQDICQIMGLKGLLRRHSFIHSFTKHVVLPHAIQ